MIIENFFKKDIAVFFKREILNIENWTNLSEKKKTIILKELATFDYLDILTFKYVLLEYLKDIKEYEDFLNLEFSNNKKAFLSIEIKKIDKYLENFKSVLKLFKLAKFKQINIREFLNYETLLW